MEGCPSCQERDGVSAPLSFTLFSAVGPARTAVESCRRAARDLGGARGVSPPEER
jgi:hypothetical protein